MREHVIAVFRAIALISVTLPASAADGRTRLHVYSATDTWAVSPLIEQFEREHPLIDIVYTEFDTTPLFNTVLENRDNANFEADVVISSAMDLQAKLVNMGLAHSFVSAHRDEIPKWAQWRNELYGFTYEPAAIVYNIEAFRNRRLPKTHSELASLLRDNAGFFDGRVGTYDIRLSGIGYLYASRDAIQGYQTFRLTESFGRARTKTFRRTSAMVERVADGDLVLGYNVISSYALAAAEQDSRFGVHFLTDYTLVMSRSAFIFKASKHKAEAVEFIEYLLSTPGQMSIARNSSLIPILPSARKEHPAFKDMENSHNSFIPIKLGTGLLAYLDAMKKKTFIEDWETAMVPRPLSNH